MMAVSALSLSRQDPSKSIDSLQHYQQTLPFLQTSMRSHQDLSSDGVFLTHFLLLIYEVRTSEFILANFDALTFIFLFRLLLQNLAGQIYGLIISRD